MHLATEEHHQIFDARELSSTCTHSIIELT
jgi:hypothetical protein